MTRSAVVLVSVAIGVGVAACLVASPARAQTAQPTAPTTAPPTGQPATGPSGITLDAPSPFLTPLGPAVTPAGSIVLPGSRPAVPGAPAPAGPARGPYIITPTLTVSGEFTDNVFQNNRNKRSDFITGFTPGVAVSIDKASYRLSASYSFTAEIYANHSELNDAFSRQNFALSASYQPDPRLTLSLTDVFTLDNNSNIASLEGISTGRSESKSNTLSFAATYALSSIMALRGIATWGLERFDSAEGGTGGGTVANDSYSIGVGLDRQITQRLTGTVGYDFGYFDTEEEETFTHTPRLGVTYAFSRVFSGSISGGPQFVIRDGDSDINFAIRADLTRRFSWGSASVNYDRSTATTSGLGGTSQRDAFGGNVQVTTLLRGLVVGANLYYTRTDSDDRGADVQALNLGLQAAYQINRWLSATAAYALLHQRSDGAGAFDVDQNRVFFGLSVAYPIRFD